MKTLRKNSGFTLTEILVVAGIIGLLATLAIPSYMQARRISRENKARNDVRVISNAIEYLVFDSKLWPGGLDPNNPSSAETWNLTDGTAGLLLNDGTFGEWSGPYLEKVEQDPWNMNYFFDPDYRIAGVNYSVVGSFGFNRLGPNVYDADDVYTIQE